MEKKQTEDPNAEPDKRLSIPHRTEAFVQGPLELQDAFGDQQPYKPWQQVGCTSGRRPRSSTKSVAVSEGPERTLRFRASLVFT